MLRMIVFMLIGCFLVTTQACVSPVKPYLKAEPDIDATIASHQKQLDSGIATGGFTHEEARFLKDSLNRIKTRYSDLKARGNLTKTETREINKMLAQVGEMLFNPKLIPKTPDKKKKKPDKEPAGAKPRKPAGDAVNP